MKTWLALCAARLTVPFVGLRLTQNPHSVILDRTERPRRHKGLRGSEVVGGLVPLSSPRKGVRSEYRGRATRGTERCADGPYTAPYRKDLTTASRLWYNRPVSSKRYNGMFVYKHDASKYKKPPAECPVCRGWGQTKDTAPVMTTGGKPKTLSLGSGCPKCYGTGRSRLRG